MFYITVRQSPAYRQMTLEDFLFGTNSESHIVNPNMTNTRTYEMETISEHFLEKIDIDRLIRVLSKFNETTEELRARDRHSLYNEFYIPKKSGGLRKIDAPDSELMNALRRLKSIFEEDFGALYHTSAFAYVKKRCTLDAVKRHQANESKWFGKYDLSNFFGSTTLDFTIKMLSMVFPFSEVIKRKDGLAELSTALDLAFLDGGLPQGTPISPLITNVMMIPIDFTLTRGLREFNHQRFVYTRYADDFLISSKYSFKFKDIERFIIDTLSDFEAPFSINKSKTRYGSSAGANWNLGVMLNKDNEITVGHRKKRQFQSMLNNYVKDKKKGVNWDKNDVQAMEGLRNYYKMVEGDNIDAIVTRLGDKLGVDIFELIKSDLRA